MGKKVMIFILTVIVAVPSVFSQTIKEKETLKRDSTKNSERLLPENKAISPENKTIKPSLPDAEKKGFVVKEPTIGKKYTQSSGLTPASPTKGISPYDFRYPALLRRNPTLTDFYNFEQMHLYGPLFLVGTGEKKTHAGLGEFISVNGAIRWIPSPRFFIEAGGVFSKQYYSVLPITNQDLAGVNARIQYDLTDKVHLNVWGQYLLFGTPPPPAYFPLFPHSGVGASISVDVNKNTDASVGAEYQYDHQSKKWRLEPMGRVSVHF